MFPNQSVLNEEYDYEDQRQNALSYASVKKLLSPPQYNKVQSQIQTRTQKSKSQTYGLIDSQGAKEYLIKEIQNNDVQTIKNLLEEVVQINIHTIHDHRKYTLLHLAAYNNNLETVQLLIEHVKKQFKNKYHQILQEWVNQKTEEGFVAFHFAAYRGNVQMINEFEKCGANLFLLNAQGMNGLHLAAQGDQPKSIVYFKQIGFDFSQKDVKGGTALHWAAYYGCELATNFLLSFQESLIDIEDVEGLTALHLATMSGNCRITKKLLLKGANKNLKNKEGQTAADIAKQNQYTSIYNMLTQNQGFLVSYFSITQGFQKNIRSKEKMYKFIALMLMGQSVTIFYYFYLNFDNFFYIILYIGYQIILWILLILVSVSNPGKQGKFTEQFGDKIQIISNLLQKKDAHDICPDCATIRSKRSKHCDICCQCIKVYDHHCPWIDNCVGSGNLFQFYLFIVFLCLDITVTISLQIYFIITKFQQDQFERLYYIYFPITLISVISMLIFLFPLWLLFYIQTSNLFTGQTTYERYSRQMKNQNDDSIKCSLKNCCQMCFWNKEISKNQNQDKQFNKQSLQLYNSDQN